MSRITILQKLTPYILATTLAVIGIIKSNQSTHFEIDYFLKQLLFFIIVLLAFWHINLKICDRKWLLILIINIALIAFFGTITHLFFNDSNQSFFYSSLRILIPTILILVFFRIIYSQKKNEKLIVENLQLKTENYKSQLENLKKQLDPHFLFNSLATLQSIIRNDSKKAEEYVVKLSKLYRNILQNKDMSTVKFKDELEFVKSYIYLQKTRFKNGLNVDIDVEKDSLQYSLPYFSIQLLIENCIKHNVVSDQKPLQINIYQKDITSITVSNNLQPKILREKPTRTGLSNLQRRYELMGITDGLTIEKNVTKFSVTLKFF